MRNTTSCKPNLFGWADHECTICVYNSAKKVEDFDFDLIIIDEAHHINSKNKTKYKGFSEKEIQGLNTFASVIRSMKSAKEEKTRFIEMSATQVIYWNAPANY